ncbi:nitrate- and nitrite sensing domain-containing protein [Streptomyces sp. NPDC002467]|uniref:sensor histidine kinase n=1 Tax=Streptomyces sp. NPDC002467 TaxID=3364647 RepID=UPI0036BB3938
MQGRFKRDGKGSPQARQGRGDAAAEQEPRGTDRGTSPQHAQNRGPAVEGAGHDASATVKAKGRGKSAKAAKAGQTGQAEPQDTAIPKAPSGPGSRLAMQNWRISTRLVSLLTLPVVAATTLGGFRINDSLNDIAQLEHMQLLTTMTRQATHLAAQLQEERDISAGPLTLSRGKSNTTVDAKRQDTDNAVKAFAAATEKVDDVEGKDDTLKSIRNNILQIGRQIANIGEIREHAYASGAQQTVTEYNAIIVSLLSLSQDMAQATSNPEMIKRTRALAAFSASKEYASIQRAIIAASLPEGTGGQGSLRENDRLYALSAQRGEAQAKKTFELVYQGRSEELLAALGDGNAEIASADHYARRVLGSETQFAKETQYRSWLDWYDADGIKLSAMKQIELSLLEDMEQKARELKQESQQDAIINGALILLVLGVSLVGAFVMARSMIRSLRRLQDTATRVAQDRLPELVKQLSESDPQDVDTSVESVGVHTRDEIGQVAAAFDDVHREAVRLAAEQALLRGNVNAMFTNLSRRSQGLIQRQLSLISELESREADPDQLSSLFKLDHLATRMRRNGENLLVLAGEEPGRRWTRPVPLVDVLRAAASEVEQYERIELASVPGTDVAGRVVNDLVHLLAELLENATSFSSPQTKVRVTGHALPDGRVLVEIHDTGIGLSPEDLAAINERLAAPPTVDVSVSRRMGLFVVGRLSLRHGIRIQLRPSDSGGTTALVMLPVDVAQGGKKPGGPGAPGGQAPAGGPASAGQGSVPGAAGRQPVGAAPQRGQVGAGGQRAALPGRDGASGPQRPQGGRPQQPGGPGQGQGGFGGGAPTGPTGQGQGQGGFGGNAPLPGRGTAAGAGAGTANFAGAGLSGGPQARPTAPSGFQQGNGFERPQPPQQPQPPQAHQPQQQPQSFQQPVAPAAPAQNGGRPQLPPRGGAPRAELPAPQTTSWGADQARGHDELSGPGSTSEFARPDFNAPLPQGNGGNSTTGQFERPDVRGYQDQSTTGQFERPGGFQPQRPGGPGVGGFPRSPQAPQQQPQAPQPGGDYLPVPPPRPEAPSLPQAPQPEALPPAPGHGQDRSPIFDTLESNWFREEGQQPATQVPAVPQQPQQSAPAAPQQHQLPQRGQELAAEPAQATTGAMPTVSWKSSPNDELMRQAERVRQPAAGGITTSGLPRRVPRANLVAGTAQQQADAQAGPQVSRAPDDVRGRLTNLRRGIQQGRQAGNSGPATGSYHIDPTYQQER